MPTVGGGQESPVALPAIPQATRSDTSPAGVQQVFGRPGQHPETAAADCDAGPGAARHRAKAVNAQAG